MPNDDEFDLGDIPGGDVHLRGLPLREFVLRYWQRAQRGTLRLFKHGAPTPGELLEGPVIHPLAPEGQRAIELGE